MKGDTNYIARTAYALY